MQLHASGTKRGLQWQGVGVVTQRQQHMGDGAARTGTGNRLVGTFAARVGFERVPQHGFSRRRDMRRPYNKVKIGRASDKNHG